MEELLHQLYVLVEDGLDSWFLPQVIATHDWDLSALAEVQHYKLYNIYIYILYMVLGPN